MYERMLDKQQIPTIEEMILRCGENGSLFEKVNHFLSAELGTQTEIRFPYGNHYGWAIKHKKGRKHICDIFAETDAFTVMLRLSDKQFAEVYDGLLEYTQKIIDNKYPCGDGGWIHCRILCSEHTEDIKKLLLIKI